MIATPDERRSARWVGALFLLIVLLQRFSVPGMPEVALLIPAVIIWTIAAIARGVATLDQSRLTWWLAAAFLGSALMLIQNRWVPGAEISITAWGLIFAVWAPFTVRLVHRGAPAYMAMLRNITIISATLAAGAVAMVGSQLLGFPYRDWFAERVPEALQLGGFVLSYPIVYGSDLYKANAWIGLEPSMVSVQIGLGLLAAIFVRAHIGVVVLLLLGLISTVSGSGIVMVGVGLVVMVLHRCRVLLLRYAPLALATVVASTFTPFGQLLLDRSTEFQSDGSSASLRALEPYSVLYPRWIENFSGVILGYGPGSSQRVVNETNILGLLVPTPAKIFFEYGLIAGLVLATFMLMCYWGSPSRTFGLALLASLLVLQPGTTTIVIVAPLLVLVTLWSPRTGKPIENLLPEPPVPPRAASDTPQPAGADRNVPAIAEAERAVR